MSATPDPGHLPLAVDGNGELHDTRAIESAPGSLVPPLRCAECGSALEAVHAHPRRDRATIIHVAAHYRLAPGASHRIGCSWHTAQVPRGPARRPAGSPVAPLVYGLVVPGRADMQTPVWRSRTFRQKRLPALNSAAKIADILTRHGHDAAVIRLDYRGRPIRWRDFLFPCTEAERLAQLLQQRPGHPVAVIGQLGDRVATRSGRTHVAVLTEPFTSTAQRSGGSRIVLRTPNSQLIEDDNADRLVIALGWWQLHPHIPSSHVDSELALRINRSWQISTLPRPQLGQ